MVLGGPIIDFKFRPFISSLKPESLNKLCYVLSSYIIVTFSAENTNATSIDFFDNVFTFLNESVTVNCCRSDNTVELATCGLGVSCAGNCSALGASLCPTGNCTGGCDMPFEQQETYEIESRSRISASTQPSTAFKWCTPKCNVWQRKGCCYNPVCRKRSVSHKRACRWFNYLTGTSWWTPQQLGADNYFFRKDLPFPRKLALWQLELWNARDSNPWHPPLGQRCTVIPG